VKFKDHFSRLAAQYAEFRPRYPGALFDFLAKASPSTKRAWDCACGSGQATIDLADRFDSVIGTDASAQQIAAASPHPHVTYAVARAEDSGLENGSVDCVTVAQSLHWFDRPLFYAEAERVLRPAGVLAVWTYAVPRLNDGNLDKLLQTYYWETVGEFWPPERRHVEDGYRSMEFPFPEMKSPSLSMRESWTLARFLGYLRSWSATARYADAHGEDPVAELEARITPAWGEPERQRTVSWPLSLRVGHK
jgi:ubiquinone/menaquinone biosynthesis C-methylase UbiE